MHDAVVRRLTAPGAGGVALVRVQGPGAEALLRACFRGRRWPAPGQVAYGELRQGEVRIDDVLLTRTAAGYELGCHAGPAVQARVLEALCAAGARPAPEPRSLAEELEDALGGAPSRRALELFLAQPARWAALLEPPPDREVARARLEALARSACAARLLHPATAVLRGPPNAGKSSLFNALLTRERALVSAEAGTTRDGVEALTLVAGVPVRLVDTAGDREATDALERAGIARARALGAEADLRLLLLDPEDPGLPAWASAEPEPRLVLWGKADRVRPDQRGPGLWVSAATGEGLDALRAALAEALVPAAVWGGPCAFTARQLGWVDAARAALAQDGPERAWDLLARARAEASPPVTRR